MTKQELTVKLNAILESYEQRITEVEEGIKVASLQMKSTASLRGQLDILVTVCTDLERLVLEAIGQPLPFEHSAIAGLAEYHESEGVTS